ncbi:MAG: hypothetical protein NTW43_01065 [Actinobacteria bacterium]|nr:hypothetical protein [Actinomycetota bacterium]
MATGRSEHFQSGTSSQQALDKALTIAKIQQLSASAAKDRQDVRESIDKSFGSNKNL